MTKPNLLVLLGVLGVIGSTRAEATLITFDALPFGEWNGLAYADQGVRFRSVGPQTNLTIRDAFGHVVLSTVPSDEQPIMAIFNSEMSFVQIRNLVDGHTFSPEEDIITATAYDISGVPILTVTQTLDRNEFLTLAVSGIKSVIFDDVSGDWGSGYLLEHFRFSDRFIAAVPGPAAFLLLAGGLTFLGLARKRSTA